MPTQLRRVPAVPFLKTSAVARLLGIQYVQLFSLIRNGRLEPPSKDSSGDYVWLPEDVERARQALALLRRRLPVMPSGETTIVAEHHQTAPPPCGRGQLAFAPARGVRKELPCKGVGVGAGE